MEIKDLYREIVNEHNLHPSHKRDLDAPTIVLNGVNPSCGDDINLQLKVEDGIIKEAAFNGSGCAISQASADMMIDLILDKPLEEAMRLSELFMSMIKGEASGEAVQELEEAAALEDISHMPARVKCAVLGWRTMREEIEELSKNGVKQAEVFNTASEACDVERCENLSCDKRQG